MAVLLTLTLMSADVVTIAEEVLHTLTLPKAVQIIEEEAFYGDTSIEKVIVPDGTKEIRSRAFAQSSLTEIELPDSLTLIAEDAFEGCEGLSVSVPENCYAYDWALSKGYIASEGLNIRNIEVEYGEITMKNGEVYWENVPGYWESSDILGIEASDEWILVSNSDWISVNYSTNDTEKTWHATFRENHTGSNRTGTIDVVCGDVTKTITVTQLPYPEARLLSPEALARDGVYEEYYDEDLDDYVDKNHGVYPVFAFEDLVTTWQALDQPGSYELYYEPLDSSCSDIGIDVDASVSDTFTVTIPKKYLEAGSTTPALLYTLFYDEESGNGFGGTRYAFYISGEGLNGYSAYYDLDYETEAEDIVGTVISGYSGDETELIIPDTLLDYPVTAIGSNAFYGDERITSVEISDSVQRISWNAFAYCTNLTSITIPESVTDIDDDAFVGCTNLKQYNVVEGSYAYDWLMSRGYIGEESVLESAHPYGDDVSEEWTYTYDSDAAGLKLTFSPFTEFENRYDTLTITDSEGNETTYTGKELAGATMILPGSTFRLLLESDSYSSKFGFRITDITPMSEQEYEAYRQSLYFTTSTLENGTLEITGYTGSDTDYVDITLPQEINGVPVTSVADGAFNHCSDWIGVTIPEGYVHIGANAFINCLSISSIRIPDSLVSIGRAALGSCPLTSITVSENNPAYCVEDGVLFTKSRDKIVRCTVNKEGVHIVPACVREIDSFAFSECTSITELILPEGLETIGSQAFIDCSGLGYVNIPSSVSRLPSQVFAWCTNLTDVELNEGLGCIDADAFQGCTSLTSLTIPASTVKLADVIFSNYGGIKTVDIFNGCKNLTEINVDAGNPNYSSQNGVLFNKDASILICYPAGKQGAYAIPETVTQIGPEAFADATKLTAVEIPETVTSIEGRTFELCRGLTEIVLPENLTTIKANAFAHCSNLVEITIPDDVSALESWTFAWCSALKKVNIPASVVSIDEDTFYNSNSVMIYAPEGSHAYDWAMERNLLDSEEARLVRSLKTTVLEDGTLEITDYNGDIANVVIPERINGIAVTSIGSDAFFETDLSKVHIQSIVIPEGITSIGSYAFCYCRDLMRVEFPSSLKTLGEVVFDNCPFTEIALPEGIESIGSGAFTYCDLTTINLPASLISIADDAFDGCPLINVAVEDGTYAYDWAARMGFVGNEAASVSDFAYKLNANGTVTITGYLGNAKAVVLPSEFEGHALAIIGEDAFEDSDITMLTIPKGVTTIERYAFTRSSITHLTLPDTLTTIGDNAFFACHNLRDLTLPRSVSSIGYRAFIGCWSLKALKIPSDITTISSSMFEDCIGLVSVGLPDELNHLGSQAFDGCSSLQSLVLPESLESIGEDAFSSCSSLEALHIPANVCNIGTGAFRNCEKLRSLTLSKDNDYFRFVDGCLFDADKTMLLYVPINRTGAYTVPKSVTEIGGVFDGCSRLTSVELHEGIDAIDNGAFRNCTSLVKVNIPTGLTRIGAEAFRNCVLLDGIVLPDTLQSIGALAFCNCSSLKQISIPGGVRSIPVSTFVYCTSLSSVRIGSGLEEIGYSVFGGCESLTEAVIPSSVTSIYSDAFMVCSPKLVIYCEEGSCAQAFAAEQGIQYSTDDYDYGDAPQYVSANGHVQMEDGTPIAGVYISISSAGSSKTSLMTVTDDGGNWSVDGLWSGRSYSLECAAEGFSFETCTFRTTNTDTAVRSVVGAADDFYVLVDQSVIRAGADSAAYAIRISSNDEWRVSSDSDWIAISATEGAGCGTITLNVANNTGKFRSGCVRVSGKKHKRLIYILQTGALSAKLDNPVITTPAEDGITVPYGDIEVVWNDVAYADHYVISLRDLTTNELLLFHDEEAMTGEHTAMLIDDYFFDGRAYRMAVAAVPAGVDSTDPLVSWCERIINVAAVEVAEDATLSGRVYGQQINANGSVDKDPLCGAVVVIAQLVDGTESVAGYALTDEQGYWIYENCEIGGMYRIYAYASESEAPVSPETYTANGAMKAVMDPLPLADDDLQLRLQAGAGVNDTGIQIVNLSDEELIIRAYISSAAAGLQHGLFAEYFQSGKGTYNALSKRWEGTVATVDFSWEQGQSGRMLDRNQFDKLITLRYDGSGSLSDVLYVKRNNFSARFTGYLIVGETDTYDLRAVGDDGVKLSITKTNGKNVMDSDGWWFGGKNQKAEISLQLEAGIPYRIQLEYYNNDDAANVKLEWKRGSEGSDEYTIIPQGNLFNDRSNRISVRDRTMETVAELKIVEEKLEEAPNRIVERMVAGTFSSYVSDQFFDIGDVVYASMGDKAVATVKNTLIKDFVEGGFRRLTNTILDPGMKAEDIREDMLEGLEKYFTDTYGTISTDIQNGIENIRKNWDVKIVDGTVDLVEFYKWLYEFLPNEYMGITSQIAHYSTGYAPDVMYVQINSLLTDTDTLEMGVKEIKKSYKSVKNVFDLLNANLENVRQYKDSNRVRSYLHLMLLEDVSGTYQKYKGLVSLASYGKAGWLDNNISGNAAKERAFVACLDKCENGNLITELKNYDSGAVETEILIYKQLLLSVIEYAGKDIFSFL